MDRINWKQPAGWIPSLVDLTSRWMCAVSFTNRQLCPQGNVLSKRLDNPQSFWLWRIKNTEAETCMSETGLQVWGSGLELASRRFVINSLLPTSNTWKPDIYVYIYIYIYICGVLSGLLNSNSKFYGWSLLQDHKPAYFLQVSIFEIHEYCSVFRHHHLIHCEYWH